MGDYPKTLISRAGVHVLVRCDCDTPLRIASWKHRLAVEGIDLVDYELPRPSTALLECRFPTVEELAQAFDGEVLAG